MEAPVPGMIPMMVPMTEDNSTGGSIRLYSLFMIVPSSLIRSVSSTSRPGFFSAFFNISISANRPIRQMARSSPM